MQQSIVFIYNIYNVSFKKYGILKNIFSNQNTSKSSLIYDIFQNMELHKVLRHSEHIRTKILYVFLFSYIRHSVRCIFFFSRRDIGQKMSLYQTKRILTQGWSSTSASIFSVRTIFLNCLTYQAFSKPKRIKITAEFAM